MSAPPLRNPAEALVALAQLVATGAGFDRLTREAAQATALTLGAGRCEVLRLDPDGEGFHRVSVAGVDDEPDEPGVVPNGISSPAGYALLCEAPIFSENLANERRFGSAGVPRWEGPVSVVAAPIPGRGGPFGVLVAYAARAGAFYARCALSVSRTASLLGNALERLDEQEALRRRAEEAERRPCGPAEARTSRPEPEEPGLTDRQLEVLNLMANGHSAKQIASELGLSIHTIHSHQRNLYRALEVGSLAGALKRARELNLLETPDATPEDS